MNWSGSDEGAQAVALAPTPANLRDMARAASVVAGAALVLSIAGLVFHPAPLAGWLVACGLNATLLVICAFRAQRL